MARYSEKFKGRAVARLLPPESAAVDVVAREVGIGSGTLEPGERFTFHDGRAKAVTAVIEEGGKASELTGHRLESTVAKVYDRRRKRTSAPVR